MYGARAKIVPDTFVSPSLSSPEQVIAKDTYTQWSWDVLPLHKGKHTLHLCVTVRIKVGGAEEKRDYPVIDKDITVRVNVPYAVRTFGQQHWKWLVTALMLPLLGWVGKSLLKGPKEGGSQPRTQPPVIRNVEPNSIQPDLGLEVEDTNTVSLPNVSNSEELGK